MEAIDVERKLRWSNANYAGTHFGGSFFATANPLHLQSAPPEFTVAALLARS